PPPSLPVALWSDSDPPPTPPGAEVAFSGLVASPTDRAIPTIGHIGRYALKYQLGEGGLGTVYAAHDPLLSRLIAVKTLNVKVPEDERESFNRLFLDEARAAGGLSHPHIVTVFDAGISDERAYIAMELLKGRDLAQLRQEGWRATPAQAALIIRRVADALAFAHSKGVIHRDIKPANIFMVGRTQPRVLDFGIARVAHQQQDGDPHTGAGSPYYMAPEQVRREAVDRRADVFSLGVVLYELLTDTKPFRGESLAQIRDAVLHHDPVLASKVDPAVPKPLALIAQRAMAKDPEQRFRSARSFARELRQWIDDNPATGEGERAASPPAEPKPQPRVLVTIAAAAAAVVVVGGLATWALLARWSSQSGAPVVEARAQPAPATVAPAVQARWADATAGLAAIAAKPAAPTPPPLPAPAAELAPATVASTEPGSATPAASALSGAARATAPPAAAKQVAAVTNAVTGPPGTTKESAKDRRAREAREREAREADARAASSRMVAPATGTVRIAISPWGLVEVDGTSSGAAPPITELTLAEGKHQIVVRNGDYPAYATQVTVSAGQTVTLRHKFGS
ncbi:MAG: serine/threonine protein kinase, partial [Rhizobacter sp.]|nr:serine/threonine protein kinase [Rhizobacter sp.]